MTRHCHVCRAEMESSARFCTSCGTPTRTHKKGVTERNRGEVTANSRAALAFGLACAIPLFGLIAVAMLFEIDDERADAQLRHAIFGPEATLATVKETDPSAFFEAYVSFLEGQIQQMQVRISGGKILGTVEETPELVHVVARVQLGLGDDAISSLDLVSVRKTDTGWRIALKDEIQAMAKLMLDRMRQALPPGS